MTVPASAGCPAPAQSLARGAAGTALLRIERALNGSGTWHDAHAAITQITPEPVDGSRDAGLFHGAPALAFVLHAARADGVPRYQLAAGTLNRQADQIARQRLADADARMRSGDAATFAEYDLFRGLTGLGALLLQTTPGSDTFAGVLRYLVALTRPQMTDGQEVPGWWVAHDPDPALPTPGGHANLGVAHGAAGILAILALSARQGHAVAGQHAAIGRLQAFFGRWRQDADDHPWWPQWLTRDQLRSGKPGQQHPGRPSWCYGAAGITRALQLAALATGDTRRQQDAEDALATCLHPRKVARLDSAGLCHGLAGLYQTAVRAAADALSPAISERLPELAAALSAAAREPGIHGLLTGTAGTDLALETARTGPPRSGWDACLLIT